MRNMSFAKTVKQIQDGTKTVTRRLGWTFLKPGDYVRPVYKTMGLKKGEKVIPIREPLYIVNVRREPLDYVRGIFWDETKLEGFPEMTANEFIDMFCKMNNCKPGTIVTRIKFIYTNTEPNTTSAAKGAEFLIRNM